MRDIVRWVVAGIVGLGIGVIVILIVAGAFYHLLPAFGIFLLRAIPEFLWSLTDLWWGLCVILAALVVWAMADHEMPSYTGPVLRGRSPEKRTVQWPGLIKPFKPGRESQRRPDLFSGGPPARRTTSSGPPTSPSTPGQSNSREFDRSGSPLPPRVRHNRHRRTS